MKRVQLCVPVYVLRSQVDTGYLPQSSLTEPETCAFSYTGWSTSPWDPNVQPPMCHSAELWAHIIWLLCGLGGGGFLSQVLVFVQEALYSMSHVPS